MGQGSGGRGRGPIRPNPFAENASWQARRLTQFRNELGDRFEHEGAAHAAQAEQAAQGAPITPVQIERGFRGRMGGNGTAKVGTWVEIARFQCFESWPITIQSNVGTMYYGTPPVNQLPDLATLPGVGNPMTPRVMLRIRVGSGNEQGGSDQGEYFAVAGDAFEVAGTFIGVDAQIFSDETALNNQLNPAPTVPNPVGSGEVFSTVDPTTICKVSVTLAAASPRTEMPTKWLIQPYPYTFPNSAWEAYVGPGRMKQAHGFNCNGTTADIIYLMFLDGTLTLGGSPEVPATGSVPLFTIPTQGGSAPYSWDCIESSRFFQKGLVVCPSSTPDICTPTGSLSDPLIVNIELYSGNMQQLGLQPYVPT